MHQLKAVLPDPVRFAAREAELAAADLMAQAQRATTTDSAMELWRVARLLEAELARVGDVALAKAEALIP